MRSRYLRVHMHPMHPPPGYAYGPISHLSVISKIIEHVVKSRLIDHITSNKLRNPHQSAYRKHHSTETVLLYIHNHLISAIHRPQHLNRPPLILVQYSWFCFSAGHVLIIISLLLC